MKELSIKEKAKAYDEAIERAKDMLSYKEVRREDMEYLFTELAESEDEKIRKELIDIVKKSPITFAFEDKGKVLAWLEKQGGQKPKRMISAEAKEALLNESEREALRTEYEKGRADAIAEIQKEWSEEDKRNLQGIIDEIEANKNNAPDYDLATYDRFLSWLKFLIPQNTWKPSDEQIVVLKLASKYERVFTSKQIDILIDLKNQLEKLKGE